MAGVLFFSTKSHTLQNQLALVKEQQDGLVERLNNYEELARLDSILLKGDYNAAIESYSTSINVQKENKMAIPLRIALAEKLLGEKMVEEQKEAQEKPLLDEEVEKVTEYPSETRKYDSINFVLEKTQVQLAQVRQQLKQKSSGEYLKFKSKKGNQLHYVGQVKNGKANGFGIALLDSGSRYEGQWKENERQGEGTFYWPDGEYYVGTYKNDKRSGFGTYYWPNGEKYAGEWKQDKRSGVGSFFASDGDLVAGGEWENDKLVEVNEK